MWIEYTFVKACAALLLALFRCTVSLHAVPASLIVTGALTGSDVMSNSPVFNPFNLDSEMDPLESGQKAFGLILPPPFVPDDDASAGYRSKAYGCSLTQCLQEEKAAGAVCACNFKTGNVVTFKNSCDLKKHNCRFDTVFKVILNEICPWEFQSRRSNKQFEVDYSDPKYYNK